MVPFKNMAGARSLHGSTKSLSEKLITKARADRTAATKATSGTTGTL